MNPKKHFGQHFLYQPYFFQTISESLDIHPDDKILEIGTGPARLTEYLLKKGANVWGVEIDKEMEEPLLRLKQKFPNFLYTIHDFLTLPKESLTGVNKIIGNLPYHLTIPILEKVIFETNAERIVFLLAEATALRFLAKEGGKQYSSATVMAQSFFEMKKLLFIDRKSFYPPPKIDSILLRFDRKKTNREITPKELQFYKGLFSKRRKILINTLANDSTSKERWIGRLKELCINPHERIENLTVQTLHRIYLKAEFDEYH